MRQGHPFFGGAPLLVAHRGGAALAPENTMAAFRQAVDLWDADMLEMDVRLTADDRLVVLHDPTVDRTTDGTGPIRELSWADARALDAGFRFRAPRAPDGPPERAADRANRDSPADVHPRGRSRHGFRGAGLRIPLFAEVLEALPEVRIIVEPKAPEAAGPLVAEIRNARAEHRVLVGAEHESTRVGARGYAGPWGASRRQATVFWVLHHLGVAGRWHVPAADAFQLPEWSGRFRAVTPRLVRAAHAANMPVHVWTVDDADDMRRLLAWGVDGIMTDRPDRLARVLADVAGRPLPGGLRG